MFEDAKGKIRSCKSKKDRQCNHQKKTTKRQIMADKAIHRKLHIEEHEPHISSLWNHKPL
jgi:hypothetical protein